MSLHVAIRSNSNDNKMQRTGMFATPKAIETHH